MSSFGDKGQGPFGYQQETRTPSTSIKGRVSGAGKITYMVLKTKIGNGVPVRDALPIVAEQYFQDLFTTANAVNMETILDSVERVVTRTMNNSLLEPYTPEEVR